MIKHGYLFKGSYPDEICVVLAHFVGRINEDHKKTTAKVICELINDVFLDPNGKFDHKKVVLINSLCKKHSIKFHIEVNDLEVYRQTGACPNGVQVLMDIHGESDYYCWISDLKKLGIEESAFYDPTAILVDYAVEEYTKGWNTLQDLEEEFVNFRNVYEHGWTD